jgi:AbrB family looped-hinge helix DNA binding protein
MATTKLSSKGQVIIPKPLRTMHHWQPGQRLEVIDTGDGILLKPQSPFPERSLEEVAGSLKYEGEAKSLEQMEEAIRKGVKEKMRDCC